MTRTFDPSGLTVRILRRPQAAAAPIVDGVRVDDYLSGQDHREEGVAMVRHGLAILPLRLWTTPQAERPAVADALTIAWRRTGLVPARWRPRYWRALAREMVAPAGVRVGDRLLDLLLLCLQAALHWALGLRVPDWIDRRLALWPVGSAPIDAKARETNAHRNGIGVPVVTVHNHFAVPDPHVLRDIGNAAKAGHLRGFRGSFDA